jgi:hypothetical protein
MGLKIADFATIRIFFKKIIKNINNKDFVIIK